MVPVFEKLKQECREEGRVKGREEGRGGERIKHLFVHSKFTCSQQFR